MGEFVREKSKNNQVDKKTTIFNLDTRSTRNLSPTRQSPSTEVPALTCPGSLRTLCDWSIP